eukprot:COSAG01_NODE_3449_length_6085_cov_38.472937_4_plen_56_part_00
MGCCIPGVGIKSFPSVFQTKNTVQQTGCVYEKATIIAAGILGAPQCRSTRLVLLM